MRIRLTLLLLASPVWAQTGPDIFVDLPATLDKPLHNDPLKVTIHRLENGLSVYLSPNHGQPRIAAQIAVRAGGRNDPAQATGMAHYLEHMLFKGTPKIGTLDFKKEEPHLRRISALYQALFAADDPKERERIYREIDGENIQASRYAVPNELDRAYSQLGFTGVNAYTSNEATVYVCELPSNRAAAWAKMESERFRRPVFRLFQSEIEAVYEEKNRAQDNAERALDEALKDKLYGRHPYARPVLGLSAHLKNPSMTRMQDFYDAHYRPNNMMIALSGDFDGEKMLALIREHFGGLKPAAVPKPDNAELPRLQSVERVEISFEAEEKVALAWPAVSARHPDADALTVMDMLMDNEAAGLINLDLAQAQKVKSAGSYPEMLNEGGAWHLWAVPKKGQSLEEVEALLLETVAKLKSGGFDEADMRAVVVNFEVAEKERLESNEARASAMTRSFIQRRPWAESADLLARLRRVGKEDVLRVARRYLTGARVSARRKNGKPDLPRLVKPNFTAVSIDPKRSSSFYREVMAMAAPPLKPRWLQSGRDYAVQELPSGRLYAVANPFNDLFSLEWRFNLGFKQERNLCEALDLLRLSGAGTLTAEAFKKKLYSLGTGLSYGCGEDEAAVHLSGLNENLQASLELMRERFESPNAAADTLKKMIEVKLGARQDEKRNPSAIQQALGEFAKRGPESAILSRLSNAELSALEAASLRELPRRLLNFKRRAAYVGNRPAAEIGRLIDEKRARYRAEPARLPRRYLKPAGPEVLFAHRDMVQALVGIFAADETFRDGHAVDYDFLGEYLGGGMSSVIFQEIRESRSLAYSAAGGYRQAAHAGDENLLAGGLGCQADKTLEAAALLRQILRQPPWSVKRFQEAKNAILEDYRANPIAFRSIPGILMHWEDLGLPPQDPRPARFEKSRRYRLSDLSAFARRFKDAPMTIFVLGPRDKAGDALKALGHFQEKKLEEIFPY